MSISPTTIERRAAKLLEKAGCNSLPVELEKIADYLDITVKYEELDDDVSGFLLKDNDRALIAINESHHSNRQRFTLAHEIGHFVLHALNNDELFLDKSFSIHHRNKASSYGTITKEREANLFASVLLMPKRRVQEVVDQYELDFFDESIMFLIAKKFGVSEQALGFRLARLNYEVGQ